MLSKPIVGHRVFILVRRLRLGMESNYTLVSWLLTCDLPILSNWFSSRMKPLREDLQHSLPVSLLRLGPYLAHVNKTRQSQAWWPTFVMSVPERMRQETQDQGFKASLDCIVSMRPAWLHENLSQRKWRREGKRWGMLWNMSWRCAVERLFNDAKVCCTL